MRKPRSHGSAGAYRRNSVRVLGAFGLVGIGFLGLWGMAAMRAPTINVPNPVMPQTNAFDFYVSAGNAITGVAQLGKAVGANPAVSNASAQDRALIQQNLDVISTLHQGFAYPYLNPPARSFDTPCPYYTKFRALARLLALQAQVRTEQGDWNGAVESSLDTVRFGEEIPHGAPLIGALVGISCQETGRRPVWSVVEHLNAAQARAATIRLASILDRHFSYADTIQEEKWLGQASLLEILRSTKKRNALFAAYMPQATKAGSLSDLVFFAYSKNQIMHSFTVYLDDNIKLVRQPYGLHAPLPTPPKDPINAMILPDFPYVWLKDVANETQNGLLLVTLALHAYHLEHGHYPTTLTELAPAYLQKLPADPFSGQGTFGYRVKAQGYVLYSVGPDGKDDGGTAIDDRRKRSRTNPNARYVVEQTSVGDVVAGQNRW